ncbi:hypothetical protein KBC54_01370 [Patescibacteria group bacterium]|nr:hypothetical protein [Patescibacteria group bacterium]
MARVTIMHVDDLQLQILSSQPDLTVFDAEGGFSIRGFYRITDEYGILDEFSLEIFVPDSFPIVWPTVKEVGGRIPLEERRHVNLQDGTLCFMTHEDYLLWRTKKQQDIQSFLEGPLRSCFISQIYFERNKTWPFGDRPHGENGRLDFYQEIFGLSEIVELPTYLANLKKRKYKGHHFCTCGSRNKIRKCHSKILEAQKHFSDQFLDVSITHLENIQSLVRKRIMGMRLINEAVKKRSAIV